jgi:hypothetical protein
VSDLINWRTVTPAVEYRHPFGYIRACTSCEFWQASAYMGTFPPAQHMCLPTGSDHITIELWPAER